MGNENQLNDDRYQQKLEHNIASMSIDSMMKVLRYLLKYKKHSLLVKITIKELNIHVLLMEIIFVKYAELIVHQKVINSNYIHVHVSTRMHSQYIIF